MNFILWLLFEQTVIVWTGGGGATHIAVGLIDGGAGAVVPLGRVATASLPALALKLLQLANTERGKQREKESVIKREGRRTIEPLID